MKWCSYCRKCDHNDSECWSTRAVPHYQDATATALRGLPPFKASPSLAAYMEALRLAPSLTDKSEWPDPEPLF